MLIGNGTKRTWHARIRGELGRTGRPNVNQMSLPAFPLKWSSIVPTNTTNIRSRFYRIEGMDSTSVHKYFSSTIFPSRSRWSIANVLSSSYPHSPASAKHCRLKGLERASVSVSAGEFLKWAMDKATRTMESRHYSISALFHLQNIPRKITLPDSCFPTILIPDQTRAAPCWHALQRKVSREVVMSWIWTSSFLTH